MNLRLTHTQTILAVAGALLILTNVYVGVSYLNQQDQKARLVTQLRSLEASLARLTGAESPGAATPAFPRDPPGIELTDLIVRTARDSGTDVLGLHASDVGTEQVGVGTYRVVRINVRLRADAARVTDFFERLQQNSLPTMAFDNIQIASSGNTWDVSFDLLAYAQGS